MRCPGCGRVFGEDNRCPHCHAIAAAKPAGAGFVCLACGKPRQRLPGTTVLGEPDARSSIVPLARQAPITTPLATAGVATMVGSAVVATLALAFLGTSGIGLFALAAALVGLGVGAGALAQGRANARRARAAMQHAVDQRVRALAERHQGKLTAAEVAEALSVEPVEAEKVLMRMADGTSITAEVDESVGSLYFVFHELVPALPKTRVELSDAPAAEEGESESDAAAEAGAEADPQKRARA